MKQGFSTKDFVWAKMQKCTPWPAIIMEPGLNTPKKPIKLLNENSYWVYFFGTHNYGWVEECYIKHYKQFRDKFANRYKSSSFKESVREIEEHIENVENNPNYKIPIHDVIIKNAHSKIRSPRKRRQVETIKLDDIDQNTPKSKKFKNNNNSFENVTFGIVGIGSVGSKIATNLIKHGHQVNIWNRSPKRYDELKLDLGVDAEYLNCYVSPRSLMFHSDIVFLCLSNYKVSRNIMYNNFGMNMESDNILEGKGLVEMSGIGPEFSKNVGEIVEQKGGRYLEACIQKGNSEISGDKVLLLTAGDKTLFIDCQQYFRTFSFKSIYLGEVGNASKMNLILQMIKGVLLAGLSEALGLAERCGLKQEDVVAIYEGTSLNSEFLTSKAHNIVKRNFKNSEQSLQYLQNDIQLGLELSNKERQPMLALSTAHQLFKHCVNLSYGNYDTSSVFMRNRH